MNKLLHSYFTFISALAFGYGQLPSAGDLIGVHRLSQTEIGQINGLIEGSLVYNENSKELQVYNGSQWAIPGFTASQKKFIEVYDSNSSYTLAENVYTKVRFNTTRINEGAAFTVTNNEIRVLESGIYEVEYGVSARTNAQTMIDAKLTVNGADVIASETHNGGWYKNVTCTRKMFLELNANDNLSVWVRRTQSFNNGGNATQSIQNGSFILLHKLK
jgi:hypothetical protein